MLSNILLLAMTVYVVFYFYGQKTISEFIFTTFSGLDNADLLIPVVVNAKEKLLITQGKNEDKKTLFETDYKDIEDVVLLEEMEDKEQNKSVVGRALVGGLLLGPVGAVVGGMSGIGTNKAQKTLHFLQIKTNDGKEIILKPFMNSDNITDLAKRKIDEKLKELKKKKQIIEQEMRPYFIKTNGRVRKKDGDIKKGDCVLKFENETFVISQNEESIESLIESIYYIGLWNYKDYTYFKIVMRSHTEYMFSSVHFECEAIKKIAKLLKIKIEDDRQ